MSSTLVEADEPQENQKSSGLDGSIDDGRTSKSGEDSDQEGKSKSTQNFQRAPESAQDNEATISARIEQNTTTKVADYRAEGATGIDEYGSSRSNRDQNDYPRIANDEIRELKRRILDLEIKFSATSRAIVRSNSDHDERSDGTDEDYRTSENGVEVEKYTNRYVSPRSRVDYPHNPREQNNTSTCILPSEREPIRSIRRRSRWNSGYRVQFSAPVRLREPGMTRSHATNRDDYESDIPEVPQKTVRVIPKLNPVEWKNFKQAPSPSNNIYAIDVLVGEPDITSEGNQYRSRQRMQADSGGSLREVGYSEQRTTSQPSAKTPVAGQEALPERIRINSEYVIKILGDMDESEVRYVPQINAPVLLFRPFRALTFHEEEIRARYTALNAKFGKKAAIIGDPEPKALSVAVDTDGKPSSAIVEGRSNESAKKTEAYSTSDHSPDLDSLDLNSEAAFENLSCLIEFIDHYIKDKQKYLASSSCQKVVFSDIWHLFKPGDEVMEGKLPQAYRVISVNTKKHRVERSKWDNGFKRAINYGPVTIHCVCIDYDGKLLGPVSKHFTIQKYEGEQNVTSLPVYPLRFRKEMNREELIARGKLFLETAGVKHMHFAGLTLDRRDEVDSQVMIDFEEALLQDEDWVPFIENLADPTPGPIVERERERSCDPGCCGSEKEHNDSYVERNVTDEFIESQYSAVSWRHSSLTIAPRSLQETRGDNLPSQDEFLIMSYRVFGFILRSRKWGILLSLPLFCLTKSSWS
ncbi:hypothetical protein BGAL_0166g00220 [Botrytis galanthina]|uniref:DUF7025 domain-containing protein n=1 Tax=Botrytis galanthina TaxID=278940 RepID=A0A4S8QYI4_9HELO|nr:hypothetical protein BGAL_0166g00220 [Botrytis galanthina]